jgi:hypothetical protein
MFGKTEKLKPIWEGDVHFHLPSAEETLVLPPPVGINIEDILLRRHCSEQPQQPRPPAVDGISDEQPL